MLSKMKELTKNISEVLQLLKWALAFQINFYFHRIEIL